MLRINRVAEQYRRNGNSVRVLSGTRIEVTDCVTGHVYRVTHMGNVVQGKRLAAEIAAERANPRFSLNS